MLPTPLACPSCNCPICSDHSKMPAEKFDPSAAAIGLFFHLQDQAHIPKEGIKKLGEYLIEICGESGAHQKSERCDESGAPSCDESSAPKKRKQPSVSDVIIDHFAILLKTDSTSLVKSDGLDQSFSETLGGTLGIETLGAKLSADQITTISRAILGPNATEAIFYNYEHRGGLNEIGFQVINGICQKEGRSFTIRKLLDKLASEGASA